MSAFLITYSMALWLFHTPHMTHINIMKRETSPFVLLYQRETLIHVFYSIKWKHSSMHHEISSTKLSRSTKKLLQTVS